MGDPTIIGHLGWGFIVLYSKLCAEIALRVPIAYRIYGEPAAAPPPVARAPQRRRAVHPFCAATAKRNRVLEELSLPACGTLPRRIVGHDPTPPCFFLRARATRHRAALRVLLGPQH